MYCNDFFVVWYIAWARYGTYKVNCSLSCLRIEVNLKQIKDLYHGEFKD